MDYEIVWTTAAVAELESITTYLARRSPSGAERAANAIAARVEALRSLPFLGEVYSRGQRGEIREVCSGQYRIFYRVLEASKQIEVLIIWRASRREPDLPD
jgi:plasmid stabilization system protein ParE